MSKFLDEVSGTETYERGTRGDGKPGPGTNGSEFFIVHSFAHIPANYSAPGQVVHGIDALDRTARTASFPPTRTDCWTEPGRTR
jgi:peptidyl-prolyl cis-trans isomerase B (cyclophilin B)